MVGRNLCTNNANQRIELWSSIYPHLLVGRVGLLMGDFNMCVDASQSVGRLRAKGRVEKGESERYIYL